MDRNFCSTKPDTEKTGLVWEIEDFNFVRKMSTIKGLGPRQDHLRSKVFRTATGLEFCLIVYPHGTPHSFGHVGIYIHSLSDIYSRVIFSFMLLDSRYQEVPRTKVDHAVHRLPRGSNWGFPKYLTVSSKEDFDNFIGLLGLLQVSPHMPKDRKISDDVQDLMKATTLKKIAQEQQSAVGDKTKSNEMNSRVADITVVCGDATRVPASSFLLCARSPVIRHLLVTNPDNDEIVLDEEVPSRVIK
eukprot:Selendium_serpulae@DN9210_c0_g1_i1.p1